MKQGIGVLSLAVTTVLLSYGCHKRVAAPPPPPPDTILGGEENGNLQQSLFKGDQAVLSDQDVARILSTQVNLTDRHNLAILSLTSRNPWSEDLAQTEAKNFENLVQALKASPQLTDVRLLPSLLVPEKHTIPFLREASARIQADLLFVFSTRIQYFRHDRFLKPDEVRAQCVAESVLLDVRTGIVVYTGHATEQITAKKNPGDLNFDETVSRVQSEARGKAMVSLANAVTAYLAEQKK